MVAARREAYLDKCSSRKKTYINVLAFDHLLTTEVMNSGNTEDTAIIDKDSVRQEPANRSLAVERLEASVKKSFQPWSSVTVLLACFLGMTYFYVYRAFPWRDLAAMDSSRWIVDRAAVAPEYIFSSSDDQPKKDVVLLGSSLILATSERLGDMEPARPGVKELTGPAPRAKIYEAALNKVTGQNISVKVLAVPGASTSDQALVTKNLLGSKKAPKLLIFTYAPRDFIANDLAESADYTPSARVFHYSKLEREFLPLSWTQDSLLSWGKAHHDFIDAVRRQVLRQIKDEACRLSGHPDTLFHAAPSSIAASEEQAVTEAETKPASPEVKVKTDDLTAANVDLQIDLNLYKSRYRPFNTKRMQEQMACLEDLLRTAKEKQTPVLLLGMPLSPENIAILGKDKYQLLSQQIKDLATKYGADIQDINESKSETFSLRKDFADSVHLNKEGSRRFVSMASNIIVRSPSYVRAFK